MHVVSRILVCFSLQVAATPGSNSVKVRQEKHLAKMAPVPCKKTILQCCPRCRGTFRHPNSGIN